MNTVGEALTELVDDKPVAAQIRKDKEQLFKIIEKKVSIALSSMKPRQTLSFRLMKDEQQIRVVELAPLPEYVEVLGSYMKGKQYKGYEVDSCVTPVVLKAVEEAIISFYTDEKRQRTIANEIASQMQGDGLLGKLVRGEVKANREWLKRELEILKNWDTASSTAGHIIDSLTDQLYSFLNSSVGHNLLALISKFLATGAGKLFLRKIYVIVSHALASATFKTALIASLKKIGIGILVKTMIGKAIIALLALVGISQIPVAWVVIPIIAGILVYEYQHFPEQLAEKLPSEITESIDEQFEDLNSSIVKEMIKAIMSQLVLEIDKFTEVKT
jgi:uncharacterized membrane protein